MNIKCFTVNMHKENTYLVWDDATKDCIIIDCGCYSQQELYSLSVFMECHGLHPRHLLCTHFHLDHTFGNEFLWYRYSLRAQANYGDHLLAEMVHYQAIAFGIDDKDLNPPTPLYDLVQGHEVRVGNVRFVVLETPGHTPGGVCFYSEQEGVLFSGDTLMRRSTGSTKMPGGKHSKLVKSVTEVLFSLPDATVVYPGHGEPTTIGEEKVYNPILSETMMRTK